MLFLPKDRKIYKDFNSKRNVHRLTLKTTSLSSSTFILFIMSNFSKLRCMEGLITMFSLDIVECVCVDKDMPRFLSVCT